MREIRIVLPTAAGELAHKWLSNRLVADFGGFTRFQVDGCWKDGALICEQGAAFDVVVPDEPRSDWALMSIAAGLFERTKERAIYVRGRDGRVELIARPEQEEQAA